MNIFNSCFYNICEYDDENITLADDQDNIYTVSAERFKQNFNYGYCLTLFRAQGRSIPYDDLGIHEWDDIRMDGKALYTCLSRIQVPLDHKEEEEEEEEEEEDEQLNTEADDAFELDFGTPLLTLHFNDF